jgi:hypothetical protein
MFYEAGDAVEQEHDGRRRGRGAMSYRLVRVNTRGDHTTRELAFDDMVSIIERGFYWKQSQLPAIPWGTQMIGMGSYGGQVGPVLDNAYVSSWLAKQPVSQFRLDRHHQRQRRDRRTA